MCERGAAWKDVPTQQKKRATKTISGRETFEKWPNKKRPREEDSQRIDKGLNWDVRNSLTERQKRTRCAQVAVAMDDHIDTRRKSATTRPEEPVTTSQTKNWGLFRKTILKPQDGRKDPSQNKYGGTSYAVLWAQPERCDSCIKGFFEYATYRAFSIQAQQGSITPLSASQTKLLLPRVDLYFYKIY